MLAGKCDITSIINHLKKDIGTDIDKLRLACICILISTFNDDDLKSVMDNFQVPELQILDYLKNLCNKDISHSSTSYKISKSGSQKNLLSWAEKNFSQGLSNMSRSVKNFLAGTKHCPIANIVKILVEETNESQSLDNIKTFDPKQDSGIYV